MLELKNIYKYYNPGTVNEMCLFEDFQFMVQKGEFVSVVGSNGSGKTSMLNLICGSMQPDRGEILINNKPVTKIKEYKRLASIGRVYQNPALGTCPDMTILENREQLAQLGLGLEDKMQVKVGALSGGQRQALSLLMSVMTPVEFLILDEHTAALDPKTADIIMQLTDRIVKEKKLTAIMVTHNLRYAAEYGDRLVMMHQGKAVMDMKGEKKQKVQIDDILGKFNEISIECGN